MIMTIWGCWPALRCRSPADQVVERLVGAAELDVGPDAHRVPALHQRVEELVHADGDLGLEALRKSSRLSIWPTVIWPASWSTSAKVMRASHRCCGGPRRRSGRGFARPARSSLGVGSTASATSGGGSAARRVADPGGVVADDQDRLVAQVLELPHLAEHDGVAEVDVGAVGSRPSLIRSGRSSRRAATSRSASPFAGRICAAPEDSTSYSVEEVGRQVRRGRVVGHGCQFAASRAAASRRPAGTSKLTAHRAARTATAARSPSRIPTRGPVRSRRWLGRDAGQHDVRRASHRSRPLWAAPNPRQAARRAGPRARSRSRRRRSACRGDVSPVDDLAGAQQHGGRCAHRPADDVRAPVHAVGEVA